MTENIWNPASTPVDTAPKSATEIAEQHLGQIEWVSATQGYCECPGKDRHTSKDGQRDCIVYLDRVPTIHCLHASCAPVIEAANRKLRADTLNGTTTGDNPPRRLTAEDKARLKARERQQRIRLRASKSLPQLLSQNQWTYAQIMADSPAAIMGNEADHWRLLLSKFQPGDVVWIGDKFDSGKPEHAPHFQTVAQWLEGHVAPGPFLCPATFKNNTHARANANVDQRPYLYGWLKSGLESLRGRRWQASQLFAMAGPAKAEWR